MRVDTLLQLYMSSALLVTTLGKTYRYNPLRQTRRIRIQRPLMRLVQNLLQAHAHIWMAWDLGLHACTTQAQNATGEKERGGERKHYD